MSDDGLEREVERLHWEDSRQIEAALGNLDGLDLGRAVIEADADALVLLRSPSVFAEFVSDVRKAGLVGEKQNAAALFVAATSRLRQNPLSILVKGSSSAGKNFLARTILTFFPASCVHEISSMSERSLNFIDQTELKNSILYFFELEGRGRSAHPNRLLLSEGKLSHWYTSSHKGTRHTREEVTGGPVACISTTTENSLTIDDESRHLSLWLDESFNQTKRIAAAYSAVNTARLEPKRLVAWIRMQKLLEQRKDLPIQLPDWFRRIVDVMPTGDVRIRRYWPAFVEACKTVCLIRSFKWSDAELKKRGGLVVLFSDFAIANLIFDEVIFQSLSRNAKAEEVLTGEMVAGIAASKGRNLGHGVQASDLVGEPGVTSLDKAYRLLKRAAHAGTIHRADAPKTDNGKFYLPRLQVGFLGTPDFVYHFLRAAKPVDFIHPITGARVRYEPRRKK
jgi:hypothetical protein